ncbi:hypothetical protein Msil_3081 [Methylocella silvestris BL2]|uniref:Uncharacterized protein n=1 Tax=Methylocella silvestris (strain DSM 15510 / CIP 108128 / LMG 27833 / NCIMB 13906 / BL2) TaxID=395965 RepID=B8EKW2_METSB|nr:hypothetical protein Msil_3081 [Methylocella silvestris BL2]
MLSLRFERKFLPRVTQRRSRGQESAAHVTIGVALTILRQSNKVVGERQSPFTGLLRQRDQRHPALNRRNEMLLRLEGLRLSAF